MMDLGAREPAESSEAVASRVAAARRLQADRLGPYGLDRNSDVPGRLLRGPLRLPPSATTVLERAMERQTLTARGYDRVLRVTWLLE